MTRALPEQVRPIADLLRAREGYLWSALREQRLTCTVCTTPINGGLLCDPCEQHRAAPHPTADQTGFLIYAPYGEQSYHLVKYYKGQTPGPSLPQKMGSLLAVGLRGHRECVMRLAGTQDLTWAVVPSTRAPGTPQPLRRILLNFARSDRETRLHTVEGIVSPRTFDPAHFVVDPGQALPDSVLLVDDSWVGGGHAQSAAAALRLAGVRHVAVFVVARVLDPNWPQTASFLQETKHHRSFDPSRCPWTTGACPE